MVDDVTNERGRKMKKTIRTIITLLLVLILATGIVFAETSGRTVNLIVGQSTAQIDGQNVTMTAPAQVVSGRTLVPLRFISEAFGCEVNWDGTTRTATVTLENQTIEVPIGQSYVVINGEKADVEVPGQIINGSTFVPLRFIGENLGAKVDYDAATKGISILMNTYKNKTQNFEMVLPAGWTVDTEASEGIALTFGTDGEALFALVDEEDGVVPSDLDADVLFEEYANKDGFNFTVESNLIVAGYQENGILSVISYVFLDSGVYLATFDAPVDTFNDSFSSQCDLMINTMKTYAQ